MGHPNEDLIRRGYDAFSRGDMDTLRELFHPDIVWHAPGRSQLAATTRASTPSSACSPSMELTGGNLQVEIHDVVANDEHAIGLHTAHAEREGRTCRTTPWCSTSGMGRPPRSGSIGQTRIPPTSWSSSALLFQLDAARRHWPGRMPASCLTARPASAAAAPAGLAAGACRRCGPLAVGVGA
jgi:ketosteroid isomerase-like protein